MLSGRGFRAHFDTPGQRDLYQYWQRAAGSRRMPSRADFDPFSIPKLLPCIGLIDVRDGLDEARFRLAGTRLRDVYGEEITGKRLDLIYAGPRADYWRGVHAEVVARGVPLNGAVGGPVGGREALFLVWMRLPLSEDGKSVDRILCYDMEGSAEEAPSQRDRPWLPVPTPQPRVWVRPRRAHLG